MEYMYVRFNVSHRVKTYVMLIVQSKVFSRKSMVSFDSLSNFSCSNSHIWTYLCMYVWTCMPMYMNNYVSNLHTIYCTYVSIHSSTSVQSMSCIVSASVYYSVLPLRNVSPLQSALLLQEDSTVHVLVLVCN